jgi:MYXO-CTERM domain-containing protein
MNTMYCGIGAALMAASAQGALISFAGPFDQQGTGFGTVLNVLTVQSNGSEWGSVLRSGGADVMAGNASPNSSTRTVAQMALMNVNAANFGVVLNINETGVQPDITLQAFTLVFYDTSDNVLFTANWNTTMNLFPVNNGTGGAGHMFAVAFTPSEATFFSTPGNRVGLIVPQASPILDSSDGPENFYIVPAPATGAALLGGLALVRRRRR